MKTLLLILSLAAGLIGQTFPSGIYVPLVARNNLQTTLTAAMTAGDTSAVVASTTGWAANMYAYICDTTTVTSGIARCSGTFEVMKVTSVGSSVLLNLTRAQDSTTAISHASGKAVINSAVSAYSNSAQTEIAAIETTLGANLANIPTSPIVGSATYNFAAQSPTSPASLTAGSRTITLPGGCPLGVNGTDAKHYLYVAGTGTGEAALITGGDCTSGATGSTHTVTLTIANAHTAGYTVSSATAGIQEAIQVQATAAKGGRIVTPGGTLNIYGPISPPAAYTYWIEGTGRSSTVLSVATTFCNPAALVCTLATAGVFDFSTGQVTATNADSGGVRNLTISYTQVDSATVALYTAWPPAVYINGGNHVTVENAIIERAWDAITSPNSNGFTVHNTGLSFFHRGITADLAYDVIDIAGVEGWVFGLTANQTTAFKAVGTNNYFLDLSGCDLVYLNDVLSISGKFAKLYKNGSNVVPVVMGSNIDMDTNGGWEQSNGYASLSKVTASTIASTQAFSVSGGSLHIHGLDVYNSGSTNAVVSYNPSQANVGFAAAFQPGVFIDDLNVASSAEDAYIIYAITSGAFAGTGTVQVRGGSIGRTAAVAYTLPLFVEAAGTGSIVYDISGLKIGSNGAVAASAFNFASSNAHMVTNTDGPGGWTYTIPSTTRWFNNTGFTSNINSIPLATSLAGHLTFATDNTYDFGASGATRPRSGYFGTNLTVGATGGYNWTSSSQILSPSDGIIRLANAAGTAFTRLQFGGTSASFPSLKRNATAIDVRLADDSGAAPFTASTIGGTAITGSTSVSGATYLTATNCSSVAAPAVCAAAAAGSVVVAAAGTTVTVNTTAVTANSQIIVTEDSSLGTKLGVTCNVTPATALTVTARTAATSFVITTNAPAANPRCLSFAVVN